MIGSTATPTTSTRQTSLVVALIAFWVLLIIPFRSVSVGFRPPDDARRHVAKAMSGKEWNETLLLRPEATVDPHTGWHALLELAYEAGIRSSHRLLVVSIFLGSFPLLIAPLVLWRGRAEAWLLALLIAAVAGWPFFGA